MSSGNPKKLADFPDVEAKLQKPSKQSAFEKQKADAEAKRKREAEETAAVYESFVKSFDHDDEEMDEIDAIARGGGGSGQKGAPFGRGGAYGAPPLPMRGSLAGVVAGKRHFGLGGNGALKSGPGSLGPAPISYSKKRGFDGGGFQRDYGRRGEEERDRGRPGRLGYYDDEREREPKLISKVFDTSDDEGEKTTDRAEERAIARPTLRLANLPPGMSPAAIRALIPSNLTVEDVKIQPGAPGVNERKSLTAIVVLSQETPATDIDGAVSILQNRYLGYGFYLSLHRHLSSAVTSTVTTSSLTSATSSQPFGAKPVAQASDNPHQPPQYHRGYAPPSSYNLASGGPIQRINLLHVPVQAPRDIKQLQLIHKVIEAVLEHGPDFEALLMSRPNVQREEKWAWLWDARSQGGVWYRWRLWEVITGSQNKGGKQGKYLPLFEGSHAWKAPDKPLVYEYATSIDEFISDPEYNSSDDDDYEDEGNKPTDGGPGGESENTYLNPFDKARLVHLLARLPTTLGRIRKGDIARVTTFAITHASRGADEIVDLIVSNIQKPFALSSANPEFKLSSKVDHEDAPRDGSKASTPNVLEDSVPKSSSNELIDNSASSLVGLYMVSDILSSSATSGVRHSWRYRQLFESALRERKVFEYLGLTAERLGWGRLRADKWKRSVNLILGLWEGWCVFPAESQEVFVKSFDKPPSAKKAETSADSGSGGDAEGPVEKKFQGRWKTVEARAIGGSSGASGFQPLPTAATDANKAYDSPVDGAEMDDVDGYTMDQGEPDEDLMDEDIDGVPMDDDAGGCVDGDRMVEDPQQPLLLPPLGEANNAEENTTSRVDDRVRETPVPIEKQQQPRRRMKAVDMFADSDDSDEGKQTL